MCKNNRAAKFGQITGSRIGYTSGYRTSEKSKDIASSRRCFCVGCSSMVDNSKSDEHRNCKLDYDTKAIIGLALRANHSASSTCAICNNTIPTRPK